MNRFPWPSTLRPKALDLSRRAGRKLRPMFHSAKAKLWLFAGIVIKRGRPWLGKLRSLFVVLSHRLLPLLHRCTSWSEFWWIAGIILVFLIGISLSWLNWDELHGDQETLSATIRNLGLVKGGVIAIILAVWRSVVGSRQADTAQRGLLNERYQKGAEMLGSEVLSVRLGGIYALQQLADEYPQQYHVQIMRLFCAFVRNPTKNGEGNDPSDVIGEPPHTAPPLREDTQAVVRAIGTRREELLDLEGKARFHLDMSGCDLRSAEFLGLKLATSTLWDSEEESISEVFTRRTNLSDTKLCSAKMVFAKLKNADLMDACLCNARLVHTDLTDTYLMGADLSKARLLGAILSGASLSASGQHPVKGLTQAQLDRACADPDRPPSLTGVLDAKTGQPLVWRGEPPPDEA